MYDVTVIGPAVIDVLAVPFHADVFSGDTGHSGYMDRIRLSYGGDALNESTVLSRLGKKVQLISLIGEDEAGRSILGHLKSNGISRESICVRKGLDTSVNIALVGDDGSRRFLMNRNSSLRCLGPGDVLPYFRQPSGQPVPEAAAEIVSFASMFISPLFTIERMRGLFSAIKEAGKTLVVDMTRPKNGETIEDLRELLPWMDVFVPNDEEISALTGEQDPEKNARLLVEAGVGTAVVKTGRDGCVVGTGTRARGGVGCPGGPGSERTCSAGSFAASETEKNGRDTDVRIIRVPAVPDVRCIDTTGAGDTFAAGFIAGLCNGWSPEKCARLGCAAASCSIERIGATDGVRTLARVMERYDLLEQTGVADGRTRRHS